MVFVARAMECVLCRGNANGNGSVSFTQPLVTAVYDSTSAEQNYSQYQPHTVAFSFEDVHYTVTLAPSMQQRVVLHSITGLNAPIEPRNNVSMPLHGKAMLSILGPSGAGVTVRKKVSKFYSIVPRSVERQLILSDQNSPES
jgi:hypothetical protein